MSRPGYQQVRDAVLARISAREWPPGGLIPPETELAEEFGVARATVSRALRELAESGMLERKRRAGTRVAANPVRKAVLSIPVTRREVESRAMSYRHKLLESAQKPAPDHLVAEMNLGRGQRLLYLRTLHLADDRPYMVENRWVNIAAVPGILRAPLETISANEWLVQNAPMSAGDIAFHAVAAGQDEALALGVDPGAALFAVDRMTWAGPTAVTRVRLFYPPGYRMVTRI